MPVSLPPFAAFLPLPAEAFRPELLSAVFSLIKPELQEKYQHKQQHKSESKWNSKPGELQF